jgi:hypothetical protein
MEGRGAAVDGIGLCRRIKLAPFCGEAESEAIRTRLPAADGRKSAVQIV